MDWITDNIGIGNYLDAEEAELRCSNGIRSMICLNGKQRGVLAETLQLDFLERNRVGESYRPPVVMGKTGTTV